MLTDTLCRRIEILERENRLLREQRDNLLSDQDALNMMIRVCQDVENRRAEETEPEHQINYHFGGRL